MNNSLFQVYDHRDDALFVSARALLQICVVAMVWFGCLSCCAQTETPKVKVDPSKLLQPLPTPSTGEQEPMSSGISFGMTIPSDWEFGLQIDSPAASKGIKATFPVPRVWPEQEVELLVWVFS